MAKLTPWFPAKATPAWVGLYQRDYEDEFVNKIPDYWDGNAWWLCALNGKVVERAFKPRRWRGLATPLQITEEPTDG